MKKTFIITLTIVMVLCQMGNVYASERKQVDYELIESIGSLLQTVDLEKEKYGLENVSLERLTLGSELPVFITSRDKVIRQESIHFYPLFSGRQWVATVSTTRNEFNERVVEFFTDYSSAAIETEDSIVGERVSVLYDNHFGYLFINNCSVIVEEFTEIEERPEMGEVDLTALETVSRVSVGDAINYTSTYINNRNPLECTLLSVPCVTQPTNYTCWAASDAAIARYYGHSSTTVDQICYKAEVDLYTPKNIYDSMAVLGLSPYYLWYGKNMVDGGLYTQLKMISLQTEIYQNGAPIFASFGSGNNGASSGHAVVVRGFVYLPTNNISAMSYMDPKSGTYKSSTVPSSGSVTITHSGNTLSIKNACGVYD